MISDMLAHGVRAKNVIITFSNGTQQSMDNVRFSFDPSNYCLTLTGDGNVIAMALAKASICSIVIYGSPEIRKAFLKDNGGETNVVKLGV